jgi:hypothetical protein
MERTWYLIAVQSLLGVILAVAGPTAWGQPVDFFEETHFRCYIVSQQTPQPAETVTLSDQFLEDVALTVDEPLQFCAPTSKNGVEIEEPEEHLTMYDAPQELTPHLTVSTRDQFGARALEVVSARVLLVPTQKRVGGLEFPNRLNHYWCYEANGPRVGESHTLDDQFSGPDTVRVEEPRYFCNPVEKIHAGERFRIVERQVHLTCYEIHGPQKTEPTQFDMTNQLETDTFTVTSYELLCVPSEKLGFQPAP